MRVYLTFVCVLLVFLGIHTEMGIVSGGSLLVPYALSALGGYGAILLNPDRVSLQVVQRCLLLILVLGVLLAATVNLDNDLTQHLVSSANFVYSLGIGYGTFVGISVIGARKSAKLFGALAVIVIVGSILELYAGLRPISDAFRHATDSFRAIYSDPYRDESVYGEIRPNFFAPEPSVVGITTGTATLFWFLAGAAFDRLRVLKALVLAVAAFVVIRSPTILVCFFCVMIFFLSEAGRIATASRARSLLLTGVALLAALVVPTMVASYTAYGHGGSFFEREVVPPLVAEQALSVHYVAGTGLGGYGDWNQFVFEAYSRAGGFAEHPDRALALMSGMSARYLVSDEFWEYWIELGVVGGLLVGWILSSILKQLHITGKTLIFCTTSLVMTMWGGITSCPGWVAFFSIAALYKLHTESQPAPGEDQEGVTQPSDSLASEIWV